MSQPLQDTIEFQVRAEKVVVNDTVKISADVHALVAGETTEEALRSDIRETMRRFVDADWHFSNMRREADTTGFERVHLMATARVPERENYNLENRAREVSRKGLAISDIHVDTSIPTWMIDKAEKELRIEIIKKVGEEAKAICEAAGRQYRVGRISFGGMPGLNVANSSFAYGAAMGADESLGNAQKLQMQASVTLCVSVE